METAAIHQDEKQSENSTIYILRRVAVMEGDGQLRDEDACTQPAAEIRFVSISLQADLIHSPIPDYIRMHLADRDEALLKVPGTE